MKSFKDDNQHPELYPEANWQPILLFLHCQHNWLPRNKLEALAINLPQSRDKQDQVLFQLLEMKHPLKKLFHSTFEDRIHSLSNRQAGSRPVNSCNKSKGEARDEVR